MNGEVFCDGKRTALGDLTNTNGKRVAPLTSGKFIIGNQIVKTLDSEAGNAGSSKRARKGPKDVSEDNSGFSRSFGIKDYGNSHTAAFSEYTKDGHNIGFSPSKGKQIFQSAVLNDEDVAIKKSELPTALSPGQYFLRGSVSPHRTIQSTRVREGFNSNMAKPKQHECYKNNNDTGECFDNENTVFRTDGLQNVGVDGSTEFTSEQLNNNTICGIRIFSQESSNRSFIATSSSQPFELAGSMEPNNEGIHNTPNIRSDPPPHTGIHPNSTKDTFGDCSCSFCTKAAYMWADLLYQDTRGRLAEVKKSRRQASILVGKSYVRDLAHATKEESAEKFKRFTNMEYDLMNRWRSLFAWTEKILQCEGTELQDDTLRLKKLRAESKKKMKNSDMFSSWSQEVSEDSD